MKIKEICRGTGLTDRTVRYYIEEGLISPFYTENYLGRKSFDFSEEDLTRLTEIATLRAFGFSVEEIKALSSGADAPQIVETVKKRTESALDESQRRMNILSAIDASEGTSLATLAAQLSKMEHLPMENEPLPRSRRKRFLSFLKACGILLAVWLPILTAAVVLVFKLCTLSAPTVRPLFLMLTLLCLLPSMVTVLIFQKLKASRNFFRTILIIFCVLCIPLVFFFASKAVIVCEHQYQTYRNIKEATCTVEGERIMKCKLCGSFDTQRIEKTPHEARKLKGVAPTCLEAGLSDGSVCSLCDTVLEKQVKLPISDIHTPVTDAAVPATCDASGLGEGSHCSLCEKVLIEQEVIPATGHSYQTKKIAKTCGTDGYRLHECACGHSYKTNIVRATNEHDFQPNGHPYGVGYHCQTCGLQVMEYGNLDGSLSGGNDQVKYYITGLPGDDVTDRTLVIYGSGPMPTTYRWEYYPDESLYKQYPAYAGSNYLSEVTTVIIEKGITSIGEFTFDDWDSQQTWRYGGITRLIIRDPSLRIDPENQILRYLAAEKYRVLQIVYE